MGNMNWSEDDWYNLEAESKDIVARLEARREKLHKLFEQETGFKAFVNDNAEGPFTYRYTLWLEDKAFYGRDVPKIADLSNTSDEVVSDEDLKKLLKELIGLAKSLVNLLKVFVR